MARRTTTLEVRRTERITPHMIRVVAGGSDLEAFPDTEFTDRYVKIVFPRPDVRYPEPFDLETIWSQLPRGEWPSTRTYTIRAFDVAAGEITIDFVHHGDEGLAGPWAANARPGDVLRILGPGGAYAPDPAAAWHLMIGDESALPAIGAACERVPAGVPVLALLEVGDEAERQKISGPGDVDVRWLYRDRTAPDQLLDAVRAAPFPDGDVHVFLHGEAGFVKNIRRHLIDERGIGRDRLSVSGYWRRGRDEDGWQADKAAERAAEQAAATR
ncbi:siderophore-interacting protein [Pseudonocardia sp. TRM90224]|uniref:siderophore-interacting protein n=1 Tax=Pseudonocardia sp. TRM90224 TaxID=2812678 RepID=UPI001E5D5C78|nr:siderophore-interacting protein [Pseudonocardia sp. TRM90224]